MEILSHAFRAHVLQPRSDEDGGFALEEDRVVVVQEGMVTLAHAIDAVREMSFSRLTKVGLRFKDGVLFCGDQMLEEPSQAMVPANADTHTHIYQPIGLGGRLMDWLKKMFEAGEIPAKQNTEVAREMARERLKALAINGSTRVIAWPTSSVESARIVLETAEALGLEVRVSFVAMDQHVPPALAETTTATVAGLEELFKEFGDRVVVIDRFPIAVSSELRRELVRLSREHGVLYEVHSDENQEEMAFIKALYGGRSVTRVLAEDGVFSPGMKVGLAHSIHTNHEDRECIRASIRAECEVFVRACPNSNDQLQSHWLRNPGQTKGGRYVPFPLREWENLGAIVTLGTDLGAGNNFNLYQEMLDERARQRDGVHCGNALPSPTALLQMGTVNGARSFGKTPEDLQIREGVRADFSVVRLAKVDASLKDRVESMADRVIRGGAQGPEAVVTTYVDGRRVV